ncbi:MAG: threonine--tRNA ligase [Planctomycetota bacterium]|nr:threonine--tRNA ligase [Planctomycetota bacterium]
MSGAVRVTLPDGAVLEVERDSTIADAAGQIGPGLRKAAIGAVFNGELCALEQRLHEDGRLSIITGKSPDALRLLRHSAAHLLAAAVRDLYPDAQLGFGPPTDAGFYYDFIVPEPFSPEDLERIEERMREIQSEGLPFERVEMDAAEAAEELRRLGYKLKAEYLEELKLTDPIISFYRNGERFTDMCRGGHVESFGAIPAFKLSSASGAYWRGDASGIPMQRIHGTAFFSTKELDQYLEHLVEARKRDHRRLGPALDLFSFHEEAPGFVFWHPGGVILRNEVEGLLREELKRRGYQEVSTPFILTDELWRQSGHYEHYHESMYFVERDDRSYAVKPMNCPGACILYRTSLRSYRELPLRLAEFGFVHRYELSGVLHGLFRVRGFVIDDAHIYCMPEQIQDEVIDNLDMVQVVYRTLGFTDLKLKLSTRPLERMGTEELWDRAEQALATAIEAAGWEYTLAPGDGAFYGPKIDLDLTDSLGRTWQCGTIQLDFQMPERFKLEYVGKDGHRHRPVMIHRGIVGSLERMIGVLVEHYAGKLPVWLSPVQAILLTITDKSIPYAEEVAQRYREAGLRVDVDSRGDKINGKIRDAIKKRIPYLLVVGEREAADGTVAVRLREGENRGPERAESVMEEILREYRTRSSTPEQVAS